MDLKLIHELTQQQITDLHNLYQSEWWAKGRMLEDVRKMVEHSDEIIAYCDPETDRLVAFSRVITDYVYKALILDVIVAKEFRNQNLGRKLMDSICNHPPLKSVRHRELFCLPELIPFYQKWGFSEEVDGIRLLRKTNLP